MWDYADVSYPALGINQRAKVTSVTFNVLKDRYDTIELSVKPISLTKALKKLIKATKK